MIIVSDCITKEADEGCINVASSLSSRLKERDETTCFVTYKRESEKSDYHFHKLNPLFLNYKFISLLNKLPGDILYIPISSNTNGGIIRSFVLSRLCRKQVYVLFSQRHTMNSTARWLLRRSRIKIIALSRESYDFYREIMGDKVLYIKTGVNTGKFVPVTEELKREIKKKYGIPEEKKTVLHVGHLKAGRNVDKLVAVNPEYQVVLVASTKTLNQQDNEIREQLISRPNTLIIDSYVNNIQEIYQMSDVYLFPVVRSGNSIDVPLSVLEAAACNLPIVCTEYGELREFVNEEGFIFINQDDSDTINNAISSALAKKSVNNRACVMEYDWNQSIDLLRKKMK